jgi:hypothetical protein
MLGFSFLCHIEMSKAIEKRFLFGKAISSLFFIFPVSAIKLSFKSKVQLGKPKKQKSTKKQS